MTSLAVEPSAASGTAASRFREHGLPAGGLVFDLMATLVCGWLLGGAYLDAWAHTHVPDLETFFTPWHAVLYAGFLAVAVFHGGAWALAVRRGRPWRRALPAGYGLSLAAVGLFAVGGVGDLCWHLAFGVEQNMDAALSPTHLLLACAIALLVSGPLRAAWRRPGPGMAPAAWLPLLASLTYALSLATLVTQYAHPYVVVLAAQGATPADPNQAQALGVTSIVLQTGVLIGPLLLVVRRWALPWGSLTLVFAANAALLSVMQDQYSFIPAAAAAGLAADALAHWLMPSVRRVRQLRLFAFAAPALVYVFYFLTLALTGGIGWTVHFWLGSTVLAGAVGLLLSYLLVPPALPAPERA